MSGTWCERQDKMWSLSCRKGCY